MSDRNCGIYNKYEVRRLDPVSEEKHQSCEYFVLDIYCDPFAVAALRAYGEACRTDGYDALADDLEDKVNEAKELHS